METAKNRNRIEEKAERDKEEEGADSGAGVQVQESVLCHWKTKQSFVEVHLWSFPVEGRWCPSSSECTPSPFPPEWRCTGASMVHISSALACQLTAGGTTKRVSHYVLQQQSLQDSELAAAPSAGGGRSWQRWPSGRQLCCHSWALAVHSSHARAQSCSASRRLRFSSRLRRLPSPAASWFTLSLFPFHSLSLTSPGKLLLLLVPCSSRVSSVVVCFSVASFHSSPAFTFSIASSIFSSVFAPYFFSSTSFKHLFNVSIFVGSLFTMFRY